MFADYDARGPFERAPGYGFRTVNYLGPLPAAVTAPIPFERLGFGAGSRQPVNDGIFAVYRRQYAYDRIPLNAVVEATEQVDLGVKETIAFDAAYAGERMRAYLFLPKHAAPPFQTVIFFPAADAFKLRSSRDMTLGAAASIVGSGRAFLYPIYKGTYERPAPDEMGPNGEREIRIAWSRDFGRAIDYLETRADLDRHRLAFYGISAGADAGVILTALEARLKTAVLQGGGLGDEVIPEIDAVNYAPRIRIPTMMLNGRYDFELPLETSQRPLFALLGSAPESKQHIILDHGHALPFDAVARVILPWLDRYLGPVVRSSPVTPTPAATSRH
jgi:dienelactone hydrolase